MSNTVLIEKAVLNRLLLDKQEEKAKFYANNGKLVNVTSYGKIPQEPMKWNLGLMNHT